MYKKAFLLAILVLGASAASFSPEESKKLFARVKAQVEVHHTKRANAECTAIKCGEEGDECGVGVECIDPTSCKDGICRSIAAGDKCDLSCFSDDLYCDDSTCKAYDKEGSECSTSCKTKKGEDPLVCDSTTKKCKLVKANPWEPCEYGTVCQGGSVCNAELAGEEGICVLIPTTAGATCNATYGCDLTKYLYCDGETSKCVEFPKKGEACVDVCNKDLYCDSESNTCKDQKGIKEECTSDNECKGDLFCANGQCWSLTPEEGEYCFDGYVNCKAGFKCTDNLCVKRDGSCKSDSDCTEFASYCDNGKCRGAMGIGENEKCLVSAASREDYIFSSLECKEGLACVPNAVGSTEGTCKKVTAKKGKECNDDSDCPLDAFCDCNDEEGKMQCIPLPQSDKDAYNKASDFINGEAICMALAPESVEAALECYLEKVSAFAEVLQKVFSYDAEYRCADMSALGAASAVTVSVVAMAAALLFALFF